MLKRNDFIPFHEKTSSLNFVHTQIRDFEEYGMPIKAFDKELMAEIGEN